MDTIFIFLAKYFFITSIVILGIYFIKKPFLSKKRMTIFAIVSVILTGLIAIIGNHLYFNPRPFVVEHFTPLISHAADNGFPSDHILLLSFLAILGLYWNRRLGIILWIITILVAVARVYVGVHHPIDVIGSMIISSISVSILFIFFKRVLHEEII